jgi:hypothetical protein
MLISCTFPHFHRLIIKNSKQNKKTQKKQGSRKKSESLLKLKDWIFG